MDEGADLVGILLAGCSLDAGGNVDAWRSCDPQGFGDIAGIEPARKHGDGRVILQEFFLDDAQALKAIGMKE